MRLNYFLRGLGVGIVAATLILTISHRANRKMSDNEVIQRAEELGMSFKTNVEPDTMGETTSYMEDDETETSQPMLTESETKNEDSALSEKENEAETVTNDSGMEEQTETKDIVTTQEETTKTDTVQEETAQTDTMQEESAQIDTTQEESAQTPTDQIDNSDVGSVENKDVVTYSITVVGGMSSNAVCKALFENGIIDNAADFDNYLIRKGVAEKIRVGRFEVRSDMSYDELVEVFCYQ